MNEECAWRLFGIRVEFANDEAPSNRNDDALFVAVLATAARRPGFLRCKNPKLYDTLFVAVLATAARRLGFLRCKNPKLNLLYLFSFPNFNSGQIWDKWTSAKAGSMKRTTGPRCVF